MKEFDPIGKREFAPATVLKERICSYESKFFHLRQSQIRGDGGLKTEELFPLKVYPDLL